jgi:hypothetical protein
MEIAIPLVALGGLYIISNQNRKNADINEPFQNNSLPNVNIPDKNYPSEYPVKNVETDLTSKLSTTNVYDGQSVYTDKYFNPAVNSNITVPYTQFEYGGSGMGKGGINQTGGRATADSKYYTSLTGDKVDTSYFQHNNMVPFFGGHLRNKLVDANTNESTLDNYTGSGSQHFSKKEQSPLFSPNEGYQWAHGMPNQTDFIRTRMNPSTKMTNVKPFEEQKVGPGLGLGFTNEGSGGFNSGMLSRESWLPKTADQLRTDNNPKSSGHLLYGREGPASYYIQNVQNSNNIGRVEKNRPETTFEMGQDRLFTTTGAEKGQAVRTMPIDRDLRRAEGVEYSGIAGYANSSTYVEGEYMPSKHIDLGPVPLAGAYAPGAHVGNELDYEAKAVRAYPNNRSTTNDSDGYFGIVSSGFGAAVAPLLDILRPSRKENTVGNLRPYQNPGTTVSKSYLFNPADRPNTTIREMTEVSKNHQQINANQRGGGYQTAAMTPIDNNRLTTDDFFYAGGSSAGERGRGQRTFEAEYNQRNNDLKSSTIDGRLVPGNMALLNSDINMSAKSRDADLVNRRAVVPQYPYQSASVNSMGQLNNVSSNYQTIQLDRSDPGILDQLKGNPYALSHKNAL